MDAMQYICVREWSFAIFQDTAVKICVYYVLTSVNCNIQVTQMANVQKIGKAVYKGPSVVKEIIYGITLGFAVGGLWKMHHWNNQRRTKEFYDLLEKGEISVVVEDEQFACTYLGFNLTFYIFEFGYISLKCVVCLTELNFDCVIVFLMYEGIVIFGIKNQKECVLACVRYDFKRFV